VYIFCVLEVEGTKLDWFMWCPSVFEFEDMRNPHKPAGPTDPERDAS
jgi:hypothetical protein